MNKEDKEIRDIQVKTMKWLAGLYQDACDEQRQLICVAMVAVSTGWDDHNELLPDWDHSCFCDSCKSYA